MDDFGAGLIEDQPSAEPVRGGDAWQTRGSSEGRCSREESAEPDESPEVPGEGESAEHADSDRPPRRRRRRRRSRSRRERPGEPAERQGTSDRGDDPESEIDEQATDEQAADEQVIDEQAADESPLEEESGADVSRGPERDEPTGPRRRRRRRRPGDRGPRRGPSAERPPIEDDADEPEESMSIDASMGSASNFDDDEDEDNVDLEAEGGAEGEADDEAPRVYRNVPTWEEAIAFLLHRRPGETRSREGDSHPRRDGGRRPDRGERPRD